LSEYLADFFQWIVVDNYLRHTCHAAGSLIFLESVNRYGNLTKWWTINGVARVFQRKFINELGADSFERISTRFRFNNNFKLNKTTNLDFSGTYLSKYEDAFYIQDPFFRLDLMLQKTFFDKKLMARIYIGDLFNTMNGGSVRPFDNFRTVRKEEWRSQSIRLWVRYAFDGQHKINKQKTQSKNDARRRL